MLEIVDRLTAAQRRVVVGLASVVALLGLAVGAVALGADDGEGEEAVRTEGDGGRTSMSAGATTTSIRSSTSSSTSDRSSTTVTTAASGGSVRAGATSTTSRATSPRATAPGGGGGGTATSAPATSAPATTAGTTGCTTAGSGGVAAAIAERYCRHRGGGAAPMARDSRLDAAAQAWAQEMASDGELAHNPQLGAIVRSACGSSCTPGENVAWQQPPDLGEVWSRWLASPPHRANLDNPKGGIYGTGVAESGGKMFYVHMFGWT